MNRFSLPFNKSGYDPFIDFLKAYAIIMVVFTHCIPSFVHDLILGCLWIDVQVPLFLLIQVFHAYKNEETPEINMKKMAKRIVLPFAIIQIVIFVTLALFSENDVCKLLNICVLTGGGVRPWFLLFLGIYSICVPFAMGISLFRATQCKDTNYSVHYHINDNRYDLLHYPHARTIVSIIGSKICISDTLRVFMGKTRYSSE